METAKRDEAAFRKVYMIKKKNLLFAVKNFTCM